MPKPPGAVAMTAHPCQRAAGARFGAPPAPVWPVPAPPAQDFRIG